MPGPTHEPTLNAALGEALDRLRRSWRARAEQTGSVLDGGGRPDVLVEDASGWPVVIEAERADHASAERDAIARLGRKVTGRDFVIETAIALVYPDDLTYLDGARLRDALDRTQGLEYALYTRRAAEPPERLPEDGWVRGSVRDLAMLTHRAAAPAPRVEALAQAFERGVEAAADEFTRRHRYGGELGAAVARILGQYDDAAGQTRRMAMTVLMNALIFHEALEAAEFPVADETSGTMRSVRLPALRQGVRSETFDHEELCMEWERILEVNYWPIFWTAKEMLRRMPVSTGAGVLEALRSTAGLLISGGVARSHDLTGIVFQRLIADRKFLATFYTRPEAAALLAGLALPASAAPGGADWGDAETLASLQVGDFACGTGTLLSTAYQRLSLLHELHGGDPAALHAPMMKHGLVGLDVLNINVHLTAAMLAGSHPDTPFDGECLLTMPYGERYLRSNGNGKRNGNGRNGGNGNGKPKETVTVGSLDLLRGDVQAGLLGHAAAVTSGGRAPEEVRDLVSRVGHGKFDLVIMNPPFTRPTNHEATHANVPNPAYAAFETSPEDQRAMSDAVKMLTEDSPSNDYAGLASHFVELAERKARPDGAIALVLPLSAMSGGSWESVRSQWRERYTDIIVVTISGAGSFDRSFSADTGMAECLVVARKGTPAAEPRGTFIALRRQVRSAAEAELLASEILRIRESGELRSLEGDLGLSVVTIGARPRTANFYGIAADAPLPQTGPWPLVGVADGDLAQAAWHLSRGALPHIGRPATPKTALPITPLGNVARSGPVHRLVGSPTSASRGAFVVRKLQAGAFPTYPILWNHDNTSERTLVIPPDSQGEPRTPEEAERIQATAARAHYNLDFQFNAQSLIAAMTERPCIGGVAWPSVIFENPEHEYAFALWCNSTLGLLLHWWTSNKTQAGRGRTTVTGIPNIPSLDTRALTDEQHAAAKSAFDAMRGLRFLPFDQIDEDPARAELDRRLLVDVLGLPESLCDENGPVDVLRRKLAREPQIHGGKKSRVVFDEARDAQGALVVTERSERRSDR